MSIEIPLQDQLTVEQAIAAANAAKRSAQQALANIPAAIDAEVGPAAAPYITQASNAKDAALVAQAAADASLLQAISYAAVAQAAAANYAPVAGETGVLNSAFPVGDVRRYGVFPDAVDLTGLTFTQGSATVSGAAGKFTAGMIGMRIALVGLPKIISVASDGTSATMDKAAPSNWADASSYASGNFVASGGNIWQCISAHTSSGAIDTTKFQIVAPWPTAARVGTNWELDHGSYISAIYTNAVNPLITIFWPRGAYASNLNFAGSASSGSRMHFYGAEFSLIHLLADSGYPGSGAALSNLRFAGDLVCWDRFGAVGLQSSDLSQLNVRVGSDPTKNMNGGVVGRGVHMYTCISDNAFGRFVVDNCGVGTALNSDAAFSLDSSDSVANSIRSIWVKTSACHGVLIYGPHHTIDELRVDNWGTGAQDRQGQETVSLAQSQELTGVWLRRVPGLKIGKLRVGLSGVASANVAYSLRVEDTANSLAGAAYATPRVEAATFWNLQARGISIGDRNNLGSVGLSEMSFGSLHITPISGATLASGYSMVHVNANAAPSTSGRNKLVVGRVAVYNPSASINDLLQCPINTEIDVDIINTWYNAGHAGRVFTFNGCGRIGKVRHLQAGGSGSPVPFTFNPDAASQIGMVEASAPGGPSITAVDLSSAGTVGNAKWEVGPISLNGYRGSPAIMVNGAETGTLKLGYVSGYASGIAGWGMRFQNNTNIRVEGGIITNFTTGTTGSAGGNVRCTMSSLQVTGNTTNTDLASGQATVDSACLNATL